MMQRCLVIMGMHRSGTSAFAGVLKILGVDLGLNLIAPAEENPKGFFENRVVVQLNEKILRTLNSSWDDYFILPDHWWEKKKLDIHREEASEIIKKELGKNDIFGIKDPRLCLLLPFWRKIFEDLNIKPNYVITVRNPLEVAESLKKRNGFCAEKSALLWMNHMLFAELHTRHSPRVFSSFDELLRKPENTIRRITKIFNIKFPIAYYEVKNELKQFLEPSLRHHTFIGLSNMDLSDNIIDYYRILTDLAVNEAEDKSSISKIDKIRNDFLKEYFCSADLRNNLQSLIREEIGSLRSEIDLRDQEIKALRSEIDLRDQRIQEFLDSTSWKLMKPLRQAKSKVLAFKINAGSAARVVSRLPSLITADNIKTYLRYLKLYGIKVTLKKVMGKLYLENPFFAGDIEAVYVPLIKIEEAQAVTADGARLSLIIPTKNAGEGFENLLKMVINQKGLNVEIVIVDSGSTDETLEIAKKYDTKIIEIPPEKFSHSYSRNIGAENASGNYLFFTVQDALIPSDSFLNELLLTLKNNDIAAVSCAEFPRSDSDLFYRAISWNHYKFIGVDKHDRIMSLPVHENYITLRQNGQLSDVACLISKDTFMKYKHRGNYAEDLDLGIRLIKDGYKLGFLSTTRIIHSHNRPAFYYLKRGYVDNISLSRIFYDQPIPDIKVDRLMKGIISVCCTLNSLVAELEKTKPPLKNKMLFSLVIKSLGSSCSHSCFSFFY